MLALTAALLLTQAELHAPMPIEPPPEEKLTSRGTAPGPWAFVALGGAAGFGVGGANGFIVAGAGLEPYSLPLAVAVSWLPRVEWTPFTRAFAYDTAPIAFTVSAPEVLTELRSTGLRLTPCFSVTVPTGNLQLGPLTTVSLALQLERRFGALELSYRLTAAKLFAQVRYAPDWQLANRLFAELWILPSLSVAVGMSITPSWPTFTPPGSTSGFASPVYTTGTLQLNWAFRDRFGLTFDVATAQAAPWVTFPFYADTTAAGTRLVLQLWFRSDVLLQRNWLDV